MSVYAPVCHLTSVHKADDIRIFYKECVSLAAAGYTVHLVATTHDKAAEASGIKILPLSVRHGRLSRMLIAPWQALARGLSTGAVLYHIHDPELMPVAWILKLLGRRVIYDTHEDLPADILVKFYIPPWLRRSLARVIGAFEQLSARFFDRVIAATPAIARKFPASRVSVVQNFPILGELSTTCPMPYHQRPQRIAYVGMLTSNRAAIEMVRAMAMLDPRYAAKLLLAGTFENTRLENRVRALSGWCHVDYRGQLPRQSVAALLAEARAGLVLYHPVPNLDESQPNKFFEYMSVGLPLIASDLPVYRSFIERERCGILVDPTNPKAIAEAITWILTHPDEASVMGERGRTAVESTYNWAAESRQLLATYEALMPR